LNWKHIFAKISLKTTQWKRQELERQQKELQAVCGRGEVTKKRNERTHKPFDQNFPKILVQNQMEQEMVGNSFR